MLKEKRNLRHQFPFLQAFIIAGGVTRAETEVISVWCVCVCDTCGGQTHLNLCTALSLAYTHTHTHTHYIIANMSMTATVGLLLRRHTDAATWTHGGPVKRGHSGVGVETFLPRNPSKLPNMELQCLISSLRCFDGIEYMRAHCQTISNKPYQLVTTSVCVSRRFSLTCVCVCSCLFTSWARKRADWFPPLLHTCPGK